MSLESADLAPRPALLAVAGPPLAVQEGRSLLRLATPIALIALVNMGMSVTDAAMVSAFFGAEALAAVAVGSDLYSIVFYLAAGTLDARRARAVLHGGGGAGGPGTAGPAHAHRAGDGARARRAARAADLDRVGLARRALPRPGAARRGPGLHPRDGGHPPADARRDALPHHPDGGREAWRLPAGDARHAVAKCRGKLRLDGRRGADSRIRCVFHGIRPLIPATSDHLFHGHPTGWWWRSEAEVSSLIPTLSVKGGMGAEGCPQEGPARPAPRPPRGWRCRARGRGRWATRGGLEAHFAATGAVSRSALAPALRRDGPSRAMR